MNTNDWHVPPSCQGQTVEVAYRQVDNVLLRRTLDRAVPIDDRKQERILYEIIELEADELVQEPWNQEPTPRGTWEPITVAHALEILYPEGW